MSDPTKVVDVPPKIPANLGKFVLEPLSHALAAGERNALKLGVPAHEVIEMILNHLASVVAMVEPAGVRADAITSVNRAFPDLVRKYREALHTSSGGVLMPGRVVDVLNGHDAP